MRSVRRSRLVRAPRARSELAQHGPVAMPVVAATVDRRRRGVRGPGATSNTQRRRAPARARRRRAPSPSALEVAARLQLLLDSARDVGGAADARRRAEAIGDRAAQPALVHAGDAGDAGERDLLDRVQRHQLVDERDAVARACSRARRTSSNRPRLNRWVTVARTARIGSGSPDLVSTSATTSRSVTRRPSASSRTEAIGLPR